MKQTNYHLFDFMDFDTELSKDEALFKALRPTAIIEKQGDIEITIPFRKQLLQEDMEADMKAKLEHHKLTLRAYGYSMLRVFITMAGDEMSDTSDMLCLHESISHVPLHVTEEDGIYTIADDKGNTRCTIDMNDPVIDHWSDLQPAPQTAPFITFYPDGNENKPICLSDDHFSPPRYDALPIGYCTMEGKEERATMSFKCHHDECFAGTGERFCKMDLSGHTFQLKNQDGQGVNNRRCYKNIPFYLSSRMYGCFYHTSDYCKLSLADHSTRSVQFLCDRATIDCFLIGG